MRGCQGPRCGYTDNDEQGGERSQDGSGDHETMTPREKTSEKGERTADKQAEAAQFSDFGRTLGIEMAHVIQWIRVTSADQSS